MVVNIWAKLPDNSRPQVPPFATRVSRVDVGAPGGGSGNVQNQGGGVPGRTISLQAAVHPRCVPRALMEKKSKTIPQKANHHELFFIVRCCTLCGFGGAFFIHPVYRSTNPFNMTLIRQCVQNGLQHTRHFGFEIGSNET